MSREKAIEDLKKMIREQRGRLDPALLAKAEQALAAKAAAKKTLPAKASSATASPETVPYDKKSAAEAIEIFLQGNKDRGFQERLLAFLKKSSQ